MACKTFTLPTGKTIDGMAHAIGEFFLHQEKMTYKIIQPQNGSLLITCCKKGTSFTICGVSIAPEGAQAAKVSLLSGRMLHLCIPTLVYTSPGITPLDIISAAYGFFLERKLHAAIRAYLSTGENPA